MPPDLWLIMQFTHSALEEVTTAPTGLASFTNDSAMRKREKVKLNMVGTKLTSQATIELSAPFI